MCHKYIFSRLSGQRNIVRHLNTLKRTFLKSITAIYLFGTTNSLKLYICDKNQFVKRTPDARGPGPRGPRGLRAPLRAAASGGGLRAPRAG